MKMEVAAYDKEDFINNNFYCQLITNVNEPVWWTQRCMFNKILCILGTIGIVVSEVYEFFTWHVMTINGEISIAKSIRYAFPEFYVGLVISCIMVVAYLVIEQKTNDE